MRVFSFKLGKRVSAYSKTEKQSGFPLVLQVTVPLTACVHYWGKRLQAQLLTILLAAQRKEAAALGACRPVHEHASEEMELVRHHGKD